MEKKAKKRPFSPFLFGRAAEGEEYRNFFDKKVGRRGWEEGGEGPRWRRRWESFDEFGKRKKEEGRREEERES